MASTQTTGTVVSGSPAEGPGFPPFATETYPSQLLWLAIFFGLLYLLVSRLFAPRLTDVIEARSSRIERDLDEAAAAKAKAEMVAAEYEQALAEAKLKAQGIAQTRRDDINAALDARRKTLEAELDARIQAAEATIVSARSQAMREVGGIANDVTVAIVERLGHLVPSKADVEAAVAAATRT